MEGSSSISVAVRIRPFNERERAQLAASSNTGPTLFNADPSSSGVFGSHQPIRTGAGGMRKVLKCLDDRILVFDPPETNAVASFQKSNLGPAVLAKKVKDIRFCFDRVFDEDCGQEEVYDGSAKELVGHVMNGFHSTVFAYGATGCGKTHTISGAATQPGIVFLIMKDLFSRIAAKSDEADFSLTVSYLEIYNETIRDLLNPDSGVLPLRETNGNAQAAGLSTKQPSCATDVVEWITLGNQNRTVHGTEANATSSRSHAVLTVTVSQKAKATGLTDNQTTSTLSIIDLAGSERASVTKNKGDRLLEGANINRSLLALGNCINALCDPRKRGHVPFRDSKLTRLLKPSLGGNCKTVMIVCVSPSSTHYDETHNTLQYANRAKEIKTKAIRNVVSVDRHVAQYCQQILEQQQQIETLKSKLAERSGGSSIEERDGDLRVVSAAVSKLHSVWSTGRNKVVTSVEKEVERRLVENTLTTVRKWTSTALSALEAASPGTASVATSSTFAKLKQSFDQLITDLTSSIAKLRSQETSHEDALAPYSTLLASTTSQIKSSRPNAYPLFEREVKVLEANLEAAKEKARADGMNHGMRAQTQALFRMMEARSVISDEGDEPMRRLARGIDDANRDAFQGLTVNVSSSLNLKRDSSVHSPLPDGPSSFANFPSPRKAARSATTGAGSTPSSFFASPRKVPTFHKASPRKGIAFKAGRISPRKKKEVQWRDEAGDGSLEDVKWQSLDESTDADTSTSSLTQNPWLKVTAPEPSPSITTASGAADLAAFAARRSTASSSLKARRETVAKPFSFDNPSRSPLSDANTSISSNSSSNSSFSMAGPSGLATPLVKTTPSSSSAATRVRKTSTTSSIGPQRSVKPNRRTSFIESNAPTGASSARRPTANLNLPMPKRSPRKMAMARRASVAIGASAGPLGGAQVTPKPAVWR